MYGYRSKQHQHVENISGNNGDDAQQRSKAKASARNAPCFAHVAALCYAQRKRIDFAYRVCWSYRA